MSNYSKLYFTIKKYGGVFKNIVPRQTRMALKDKLVQKNISEFLNTKKPYDSKAWPEGVNLIGSIRAEMGLGQSCRLVARQLQMSGYPFSICNIGFDDNLREDDHSWDDYISAEVPPLSRATLDDRSQNNQRPFSQEAERAADGTNVSRPNGSSELPYGINLFHVNLCEMGNMFSANSSFWDGHYNIAFWLWELEDFPKEWVKYCSLFDEIWTPSAFAGRGMQKAIEVPVRTVPYRPTAPYDDSCTRDTFDLPENKFLCLIMYDSNSTTGRKNPQGAIAAYRKAFPQEDPDCGLVIKINNAKEEDVRRLKKELDGYCNVYFITKVMKKEKVNSLIRCCDVYLSLHRSEGFGLVIAEAMLLGTPVIATNYSSNVEFMSEEASCLVDYQLIKNLHTEGAYKRGCIWADPDLDQAADYIRRLKNDRVYYESKVTGGAACINQKLNEEELNGLWRERIAEINCAFDTV
ncbi:MAG: glycosyltransferase [Clostridiales bacterium]|nr:glycosyltransferase [Clostridiales bacterium]